MPFLPVLHPPDVRQTNQLSIPLRKDSENCSNLCQQMSGVNGPDINITFVCVCACVSLPKSREYLLVKIISQSSELNCYHD